MVICLGLKCQAGIRSVNLEVSNAPEKPEYKERILLKGSCQMLSFVDMLGWQRHVNYFFHLYDNI